MKKHLHKKTRPLSKGLSRLLVISIAAAIAALTTGLVISFSRQRVNAKDQDQKQSAVRSDAKAYITRNVGGQTVQIDPQTGQVRPLTPDEARKLADGLKELANQSTEGLQQVQHPDGSVSIDLQGRFQNVTVARKDADGTLVQSCIDNPQAGAAFFRIDPKLVGPPEKSGSAPTSKSPANR